VKTLITVMLISLPWLVFLGCSQNNGNGIGPTTPGSIQIYWPIAGVERTDSVWVPKDSLIHLKVRDQDGDPVSNVSWHTSDSSVVSVNSSGYVYGLKDWFDNGNSQPEAIVWATKNELTSNEIVVQTVVNLTGRWRDEWDGEVCNVRMRFEGDWIPPYWWACPFPPLGGLLIIGDSLYWECYYDDSWAWGHVLENGRRVEFRIHYTLEDTTGAPESFTKISD